MDLGKEMKSRREYLNISQQDLSEMGMVSISTIKDIERGKGNPSLSTILKILDVLGLEIKYCVKQTVKDDGLCEN
ncbi:MAG: helix-turn-helix domain-containing protein [Muribaculaceae bacterium]